LGHLLSSPDHPKNSIYEEVSEQLKKELIKNYSLISQEINLKKQVLESVSQTAQTGQNDL